MVILIGMFIAHWLFDFVLQKQDNAINKSSSVEHLSEHVMHYTLGTTFILLCLIFMSKSYNSIYDSIMLVSYGVITFLAHFSTDFVTSRITKNRYKNNKLYGFNSFWFWIGLDQVVHIIQIVLTLHLLGFVAVSNLYK